MRARWWPAEVWALFLPDSNGTPRLVHLKLNLPAAAFDDLAKAWNHSFGLPTYRRDKVVHWSTTGSDAMIVGEGEACGGSKRCPYRSQCAGGVCVRTELVGEQCGGEVGCASGFCSASECRPLKGMGEICGEASQCVSGRCRPGGGGLCDPITWSCVP